MKRLFATLVTSMLVLVSCSSGPSPEGDGGGSTQTLRATGGIDARFAHTDKQRCSVSEADGPSGPVSSFVFNGAQTVTGPDYVLFFSIFPFEGASTYTVGGSSRSKVIVASTSVPTQSRLEATSGSVVVSNVSPTEASGSMKVRLVAGSSKPTTLSGTWRCSVTAL